MMNLDITRKGEVVKTVKLPWTVASPVVCGAIVAAYGAVIGTTVGLIKGVWWDGKSLINHLKKK